MAKFRPIPKFTPEQFNRRRRGPEAEMLTAQAAASEALANAVRDMSQREANKIARTIQAVEPGVLKAISETKTNPAAAHLITYYSDQLRDLYYESVQASTDEDVSTRGAATGHLRQLDILIDAIKNDKILAQAGESAQKPLLDMAAQIKQAVNKRRSVRTLLKEKGAKLGSSLFKGDIVQGMMQSAIAASPLVRLMASATRGVLNLRSSKKNTFGQDAAADKRRADIARQQESVGGRPTAPPAPKTSFSDDTSESNTSGSGNKSINKILLRHTVLLEKIYGTLHGSLKLQQQQIGAQLAADEESVLETQDTKTTATKLFGDNTKEKPKGFIKKVIDTVLPIARAAVPVATVTGGTLFGATAMTRAFNKLTGNTELKPFIKTLNETAVNLGLSQEYSDAIVGTKKDVSFIERMKYAVANSITRVPALLPAVITAAVKTGSQVGGNFILDQATKPGASSTFTNTIETATKLVEEISPAVGKIAQSRPVLAANRLGGLALRSFGFAGRAMEAASAYNSFKKFREARAEENDSFLGSPETLLRGLQGAAHTVGVLPGVGIPATFIGAGLDYIIDKNYENSSVEQTATRAPSEPSGIPATAVTKDTKFSELNKEQQNAVLIAQAKFEHGSRIKNNNPGNIMYAGPNGEDYTLAKQFGGVASNTVTSHGTIASFPTMEAGLNAQRALWNRPNYRNLSIADAIKRWSPAETPLQAIGQMNYIKSVMKAAQSGMPVMAMVDGAPSTKTTPPTVQPTPTGVLSGVNMSGIDGDTTQNGRVTTLRDIMTRSPNNGGGQNFFAINTNNKGGDTFASGGGGGDSMSMNIPSPSDREPSLRHSGLA